MRRIISMLLAAALLMSLYGCGRDEEQEKEYGNITAVEISDEAKDPEEAEKSVFNKLPEEFGYTYSRVKVPRANMAFEVPDNWDVTVDNARHIVIESGDDADFPKLRIHLFLRYDMVPSDSEHPEESSYSITNICSLFNSDRPKTYYPVNGEEYIISQYIVHQVKSFDDKISGDSSMLLMLRSDDIPLTEPVIGTMPKDKYSAIDYAISWYGIPVLFRTVCKTENAGKTQALLSYIASSVTYSKSSSASYLKQDLGLFSVKLPEEFVITGSKDQTVYISPFNKAAGSYAGMGIGVFDTKTCEEQNYGNVVRAFTMNPADKSLVMPAESFGPCNINGISFDGSEARTVTILPGKEYAADFYRQNQTCYFFSFKYGDKELIVWNCPNQEEQYENLYYNCLESSLCIN